MAEELGERTELPTGKRRAEARQRAQVAKSADLAAAVELIGAVVLLILLGPWAIERSADLIRRLLETAPGGDPLSPATLRSAIADGAARAAWIAAPIVGLMFVIGVAAHVAQVGWLFTLYPVQPRLNRLSPVAGVRRLVGRRNAVRTAVSCLKLALIAAVAASAVLRDADRIAAIPLLELGDAFALVLAILRRLAIWILVIMLVLGLIDYAYQRWQLTQDLRMTRQEVKDERRAVEGDLDVKARRLRMARSLVYQRIRHAVPTADVVVTNPTHVAVALRYDRDTMDAPRVVAKGADELAFRIREIAAAHRVPIVEKPPLARALYASIPVGRSITPEFYEAVAEILAYVYRLEGRAA